MSTLPPNKYRKNCNWCRKEVLPRIGVAVIAYGSWNVYHRNCMDERLKGPEGRINKEKGENHVTEK